MNAPARAPSASVEQLPECPPDIVEEDWLEQGLSRSIRARAWVPSLSLTDLGFVAGSSAEQLFQQEVSLASGTVEVIGLGAPTRKSDWGALVFARPHAQGHCVVNGWSTSLFAPMTLSLADSWRSPDGRFAIFLLKLLTEPEKGKPEVRWVSLGTDGHRAWIALGEPPQHQLIAPTVTFFRNGKDLYVDIHQRYITRLRLGPDGHFIVPPKAK
ncbi:hypothetical protein [Corallococcus carmarthensis]|uniref:hypothetical protein n=1 Tax=Corallococcus carmarthensis TaxID=2316728 RepID=UPI00148E8099|nr:hypothetical protein [Corallococcus carmarthensis]NOK16465.1 hypothetical protein [Corallococcus carmarthensis]